MIIGKHPGHVAANNFIMADQAHAECYGLGDNQHARWSSRARDELALGYDVSGKHGDRRYFVPRSKAMQAVTPCFLRRTCAVVQAILKKYSIYTSYAMHCTTAQLESNLRVVLGTCSLVLHFWPFWPVLGPTTTCEISKSPHSEKPRLGTLKPPAVG